MEEASVRCDAPEAQAGIAWSPRRGPVSLPFEYGEQWNDGFEIFPVGGTTCFRKERRELVRLA
jgi:hypothetical protein